MSTEAEKIYDDEARRAACMEYLKASVQVHVDIWQEDTHESIPSMLAALLAAEVIFLNNHWWQTDWPEQAQKTAALCVECNDIFAAACADAEEVSLEEIPDLYEHWLKDPQYGARVWCIKKRGIMPQSAYRPIIERSGMWDLGSMGLADRAGEPAGKSND